MINHCVPHMFVESRCCFMWMLPCTLPRIRCFDECNQHNKLLIFPNWCFAGLKNKNSKLFPKLIPRHQLGSSWVNLCSNEVKWRSGTNFSISMSPLLSQTSSSPREKHSSGESQWMWHHNHGWNGCSNRVSWLTLANRSTTTLEHWSWLIKTNTWRGKHDMFFCCSNQVKGPSPSACLAHFQPRTPQWGQPGATWHLRHQESWIGHKPQQNQVAAATRSLWTFLLSTHYTHL